MDKGVHTMSTAYRLGLETRGWGRPDTPFFVPMSPCLPKDIHHSRIFGYLSSFFVKVRSSTVLSRATEHSIINKIF